MEKNQLYFFPDFKGVEPEKKLDDRVEGIVNTRRQHLLAENKAARLTALGVEWDSNIHEDKKNQVESPLFN